LLFLFNFPKTQTSSLYIFSSSSNTSSRNQPELINLTKRQTVAYFKTKPFLSFFLSFFLSLEKEEQHSSTLKKKEEGQNSSFSEKASVTSDWKTFFIASLVKESLFAF